MTTPCENLGYTEGMQFIVCDDTDDFDSSEMVWLHEDDNSHCPTFRNTEDYDEDNTELQNLWLKNVAPVIKGKTPA